MLKIAPIVNISGLELDAAQRENEEFINRKKFLELRGAQVIAEDNKVTVTHPSFINSNDIAAYLAMEQMGQAPTALQLLQLQNAEPAIMYMEQLVEHDFLTTAIQQLNEGLKHLKDEGNLDEDGASIFNWFTTPIEDSPNQYKFNNTVRADGELYSANLPEVLDTETLAMEEFAPKYNAIYNENAVMWQEVVNLCQEVIDEQLQLLEHTATPRAKL